jgi:hypothetical protein
LSSGSKSPARQCSDLLQSRLNETLEKRFNQCGSMEYSLTSKVQITPAGRRIFRLRASAHRTFVNVAGGGRSGWPTPSSRDWKDTPGMATTGTNPDGSERTRLDQLPRVANLAGWATPRAEDSESSGMRHSRGVADTLTAQASVAGNNDFSRTVTELAGWSSPRVSDANTESREAAEKEWIRSSAGGQSKVTLDCHLLHGVNPDGTPAEMANTEGFQLNPAFSLWLMGFPIAWHNAGLSALRSFVEQAMPSARKSRQSSSKRSSKASE